MSYQKKDWRGPVHQSFFWYNNNKDLKKCNLTLKWAHPSVLVEDLPYTNTDGPIAYGNQTHYFLVWILVQWRTDRQTDGQTESDAYEPTVHKHRCAQKKDLKVCFPVARLIFTMTGNDCRSETESDYWLISAVTARKNIDFQAEF